MKQAKKANKKTGIFWFSNDLRLHDNPALDYAKSQVGTLICIYIIDKEWLSEASLDNNRPHQHRLNFLKQSLQHLSRRLNQFEQALHIFIDKPEQAIAMLIKESSAGLLFRSRHAGLIENRIWNKLEKSFPQCQFESIDSHTLFEQSQLPLDIKDLPTSFSKFRKTAETLMVKPPINRIEHLPSQPSITLQNTFPISLTDNKLNVFKGGEQAGLNHLMEFFNSSRPSHYKQVRNALDGWDNSCKFSAWLANGCISARTIYAMLKEYEQRNTANDSTYWIFFELLWREFFQWHAKQQGKNLFLFQGLNDQAPSTSYDDEKFQSWVNGKTAYPIVNACMNQLRETGYLSNRGRQIVASCLVNELAIDWRFGAAYFEAVLIDYDVASNWGNWQYIAGVGTDSRGGRHFNLDKQTQQFDPKRVYIDYWTSQENLSSPIAFSSNI